VTPVVRRIRPLGLGWPNIISVLRILLVPVLVVLILSRERPAAFLAAALFVLAAVTDGLDGYLARRHAAITRLGQWLDPLADKALVTAPVIAMVITGTFPLWAAAIIVAREFAVSLLRAWLGTRGRAMPASFWGKVKTTAQMVVVLLYLLPVPAGPMVAVRFWLLVVAVVLTVWSGIDYLWRAFRAPART
jgi:CDP-diacylglycerol--glycerol-3-phosphate 3-phosphatidyltransferase